MAFLAEASSLLAALCRHLTGGGEVAAQLPQLRRLQEPATTGPAIAQQIHFREQFQGETPVPAAAVSGAQETAAEQLDETPTEDGVIEGVSTEDITVKGIATEGITTEDTATEDTATEEIATEQTATEEIATQDSATQERPANTSATSDDESFANIANDGDTISASLRSDDESPFDELAAVQTTAPPSLTGADIVSGVKCGICLERKAEQVIFRTPCAHSHCFDCIIDQFQDFVLNAEPALPQCCGEEILLDKVSDILPMKLFFDYWKRHIWFNTTERIKCFDELCGEFIPPREINRRRAYCCACKQLTCVDCETKLHDGVCPKDPEEEKTLAVARRDGLQQCYGCGSLVQREYGCNHMSKYNSFSTDS